VIRFDDRVALVVGGSGGIGLATLEAFSEAGAKTVCLDVRPPSEGEHAFLDLFVEVDVSDGSAVQAAVTEVAEAAGRIDVVVYCAGITRDAALWKLSAEDWASVIGVNLTGAFNVLGSVTPHLRKHGGAVVLVASINGERGKRGQANYAASKGGLIALGKTAARELGYFGVRVNVISPGLIETPMIAKLPDEVLARARNEAVLERRGRPEDVANAALFLTSELSAHITGQVLRVDGGQLI
jgi:3-oxoacyl-[acyl-carrier protein] reductase